MSDETQTPASFRSFADEVRDGVTKTKSALRKAWDAGTRAAIGGAVLGMVTMRPKVVFFSAVGCGLVGAGVSLYNSYKGTEGPSPPQGM